MVVLFQLIMGFLGYFVGIKAPLILQLLIIAVAYVWLKNQRTFEEIAALIPLIGFACLCIGIIVGDIVFAVFHPDHLGNTGLLHGLSWLFTP